MRAVVVVGFWTQGGDWGRWGGQSGYVLDIIHGCECWMGPEWLYAST